MALSFSVSNSIETDYKNFALKKEIDTREVLIGVILYLSYNKLNIVLTDRELPNCIYLQEVSPIDLLEELKDQFKKRSNISITNIQEFIKGTSEINKIITDVQKESRRHKLPYNYNVYSEYKEIILRVVMMLKTISVKAS